nr:RNA polymerase alpha subunit [Oedogonium sp. 260-2_chl]
MLKLYFIDFFFVNSKIKKKFYNNLSNAIVYTRFFYNIDFPIFVSCRQIVKKNLRNIYGQFYIGPFFVGQGLTVANALRRTLLSELSSLAITSVYIENVVHQYQTIQGLQESVFEILINLKEIVFCSNKPIKVPQIGYLQVQGPCVIKAKDLLLPCYIHCVDSEQYIATLSQDSFLNLKFIIRHGKSSIVHVNYGFDTRITKEKIKDNLKNKIKNGRSLNNINYTFDSLSLLETNSKNLIIDAFFNPVIKVNYMIELLDFDKLSFQKKEFLIEYNDFNLYQKDKKNAINKEIVILEIWTNGSISPVNALKKSIQKLIRVFLKLQKSKILTKMDISYTNIFEVLNNEYNFLRYKQCQTLSDFKAAGMSYGNFSEKYFIEQLTGLINQLE